MPYCVSCPNVQQQLQATIGWRPEPRRNVSWQPRQPLFPFLPERPTTCPRGRAEGHTFQIDVCRGVGSVNCGLCPGNSSNGAPMEVSEKVLT